MAASQDRHERSAAGCMNRLRRRAGSSTTQFTSPPISTTNTVHNERLRGVVRYSVLALVDSCVWRVSNWLSTRVCNRLVNWELEIERCAMNWLYLVARSNACRTMWRFHSSPSNPSIRPIALVAPGARKVGAPGSAGVGKRAAERPDEHGVEAITAQTPLWRVFVQPGLHRSDYGEFHPKRTRMTDRQAARGAAPLFAGGAQQERPR